MEQKRQDQTKSPKKLQIKNTRKTLEKIHPNLQKDGAHSRLQQLSKIFQVE
jgi:hypothetical protein